jgi:hypothetical protein
MGFRSLQHTQGAGVFASAGFPARSVPSSGFGYPLDGFHPLRPGRVYFAPTALVGFALRSLLPPAVSAVFPRGWAHVPLLPPFLPAAALAEACVAGFRAGPTGRGFWALLRRQVVRRRLAIN